MVDISKLIERIDNKLVERIEKEEDTMLLVLSRALLTSASICPEVEKKYKELVQRLIEQIFNDVLGCLKSGRNGSAVRECIEGLRGEYLARFTV